MTDMKTPEVRGALTRIKEALENERRYYEALRTAGRSIADVAERLQSGSADPEAAATELLDVARGILAAMGVSIPEEDDDEV